MGLRISIQGGRSVLRLPEDLHEVPKRFECLRLKRAHFSKPKSSNQIKKSTATTIRRKCAVRGLLMNLFFWTWPEPSEDQLRKYQSPCQTEAGEAEVDGFKGRLGAFVPPKDGERWAEKVGYIVFVFVAFCMVIEIFLMDDDTSSSTSTNE